MPRRLAQQRMTLSDLEWPFHASHAISAVAELLAMSPPMLAAGGIMLAGCLSVSWSRVSSLARYFINYLAEFHQIYNFRASGDKDELIRFWGQWSKVKVTTTPYMTKHRFWDRLVGREHQPNDVCLN